MNAAAILILVLTAGGQVPAATAETQRQAAKARSERLRELHTNDATTFAIYRDAGRTQKLELRREPVYRWLQHKGREVWSSIRDNENTFNYDAKHRFRFYQDRIIPEISDEGSKGAR